MNRPRPHNFFLILMLGALCTVTPFSIDMYLPAFPEIAKALNASLSAVAFSVSSYFIGFALGQVIYGPLLDRYGRKPPIYVGLLIYILSSLGCCASRSVEMLIFFRFFQAVGGCVAGVASTAMVRDFFPVEEGAKVFSMMMLILGVSPLLAPTVGSFFVVTWGWQSVFAALALITTLILLVIFLFLPEGHKPDPTVSLRPLPIFRTFKEILKDRQFSTYSIAGSFSFAGLFVYVAGSPSIFMGTFHVSTQIYGLIFAVLSIGMIGGGQLNLLLARRFTNHQIFRGAVIGQVITSAIFLVCVLTSSCGLYLTIALLFILLGCTGLTYPNAAAMALLPFERNAGSASSLLGFLQIGLGALTSMGVGLLNIEGSLPTALTIAASSSIALAILLFRP